jgi:membrane protein YdbS with pleckstrin-like domain
MKKNIEKPVHPGLKTVIVSLFWILILALITLGIMIWISPEAKGLVVFLIGFFITVVIIVLIALYINYAVSIYKQIKDKP